MLPPRRFGFENFGMNLLPLLFELGVFSLNSVHTIRTGTSTTCQIVRVSRLQAKGE